MNIVGYRENQINVDEDCEHDKKFTVIRTVGQGARRGP